MKKPILVIKFGSASITNSNQELDEEVIASVAKQVSSLNKIYNIVLVSSGAVAAGKKNLKKYKGTLSEKKAAAAIGNPLLLQKYSQYFAPFDICIAQSLCERHHFSNRNQFLQLKKTYEELWKSNIIPIANENDVVSNLEIKFSDNDELATLIAVGFGAEMILYCTSVPGVFDASGNVIKEIKLIDKEALLLAKKEKSSVGLGGMTSKLTFARLATQMGIKAAIFGIKTENAILNAVIGKTGTFCAAQKSDISARNKWLASGSLIKGKLQVDEGAVKALQNRHSLLAVGVTKIIRNFDAGEVIEILDAKKIVIAVAKSKIDSAVLKHVESKQNLEIAHADDIVLI
ncbi:glutamate 5-kinase [Pedobacter sp. SD-b]|uniref:Glutamate 5-kinase n=1 Tax=Pedobacter segetis TaxID=2793069 RepID=A0ABS1BI17_9SPHI|nr:glutamate 5-kinase [Pedobacter segetis]MBK0382533.1 glutamate 5-kinase [Pedobacter segetis]